MAYSLPQTSSLATQLVVNNSRMSPITICMLDKTNSITLWPFPQYIWNSQPVLCPVLSKYHSPQMWWSKVLTTATHIQRMSQLVDSNSPTGICPKLQLDGLPTIINTNPSPGFKVLTDGLHKKQYRLRIKTRTQLVRGQYKKSKASLHAIIHRSSSISFNVHISTSSHVVSGLSAREMLTHHDQFCSTRLRGPSHDRRLGLP